MAVGIDIVEHERFMNNHLEFARRYLHQKEIAIFNGFKNIERKINFLASRIAAKEAIFKCYKHGDGTLDFNKIAVLNDEFHAPYVMIRDKVINEIEISISHSKNYSIAIAILKEYSS